MTKIKICGLRNLPDTLAAIDAGADLLGFNFYPKSPRRIEIGICRGITSKLRSQKAHVVFVGVFVNLPVAEVHATLETCGLELAQLHGDETPEMLAQLGTSAFKAIRLSASQPVQPFLPVEPPIDKPALLVDAAAPGLYGGSGLTADWEAAARLARHTPLLLAGGLTPENVSEAIWQVQPWGVDVASGVESSPGVKDPEKMKAFVAAVRAAHLIQPAQIQDLEEILALQKLAYQSEAQLNHDFTIPPLHQTLDEIRAEFEQAAFLKIVQAGKIIGSVRAKLVNDTCQIGKLIVHPERQNQGLGSRLLREIELRVNAPRYELFTSQRSERNLHLYRKSGYRDFKQTVLNEHTTLIFLEKFNDHPAL